MKNRDGKKLAIWAALPLLMIALYLTRKGTLEAFPLLLRELLLIFGFLAAAGDLRDRRVPNRLVLGMAGAWALAMLPQFLLRRELALTLAISGAVGAFLGGAVFLSVYVISRHGLGGGDVKFMTAAGLYLGFQGVMPTMLVGSVLAAVTGLGLILTKRMDRKGAIPLIPFLYAGIIMTMFFR